MLPFGGKLPQALFSLEYIPSIVFGVLLYEMRNVRLVTKIGLKIYREINGQAWPLSVITSVLN